MNKAPSYHDLFLTTPRVARTSVFNLPYRVRIQCTRVGGWEAWAMEELGLSEELLGAEYSEKDWLILDVAGYVICDNSPKDKIES
jgi:hypothetical protein